MEMVRTGGVGGGFPGPGGFPWTSGGLVGFETNLTPGAGIPDPVFRLGLGWDWRLVVGVWWRVEVSSRRGVPGSWPDARLVGICRRGFGSSRRGVPGSWPDVRFVGISWRGDGSSRRGVPGSWPEGWLVGICWRGFGSSRRGLDVMLVCLKEMPLLDLDTNRSESRRGS